MASDELSESQKATLNFIDHAQVAKTIDDRADEWVRNTVRNRPHYTKPNPPLKGLTVYVVSAGPSLAKNAEELKKVGRLGVVMAVDASFRYLMQQGVVPDYCVSIDASGKLLSMVEGTDTQKTILVCMASSSPELVDYWKGPKFFVRAFGGSRDLDDKLVAVNRMVRATRDIKAGELVNALEDVKVEFPGLGVSVPSGGNVTTSAHAFATQVLRATRLVFVGADYSFAHDGVFYCGNQHKHLSKERTEAEQLFGIKGLGCKEDLLLTNMSMFNFKNWHEDVLKMQPVEAINATEGGILGVNKDGGALPGWEHMPLADAVAKFTPMSEPRKCADETPAMVAAAA